MNRLWRGVVAASVALSLSVACAPAAVADDEQFPDAALRACVARNLAEQRLAATEYAKLTTLSCAADPDGVITSLSGLDALAAVKSIILHGHDVTDFGPLRSLPTLLDLELDVGAESQVGSLAGFSLRILKLHASGARLPTLPELDVGLLDVQGADLTDLVGIARVRMEILQVRDTPITDLSGPAGQSIKRIYISGAGSLRSLAGLAELRQLQRLEISAKSLVSIDELAGLTELMSLSLRSPDLTDVSVVTELPKLQSLSLYTPQPIDLGPTGSLRALTSLSVSGAKLTSLEALRGSTALVSVQVQDTQVSDISPLADLPDGARINLYGNRITDFSPLAGWTGTLSARSQVVELAEPAIAEVPYPLPSVPIGADGTELRPSGNGDSTYADGYLTHGPAGVPSQRRAFTFANLAGTITVTLRQLVNAQEFSATGPDFTRTPQVGVPVTVESAAWIPAPDRIEYQWFRYDAAIPGAIGPTYTPTEQDIGKQLQVRMTAVKPGYVRADRWGRTEAVLARDLLQTPTPTLSWVGPPATGVILTVNPGDWDPHVTLAYQWQRNGLDLAGATGSSYRVSPADLGTSVRVAVTGSHPYMTPVTRYSSPVTPVAASYALTPRITGKLAVDGTLGAWVNAPAGSTLQFRWYRNGKPARKGTKSSYPLAVGDLGAKFTVRVTASKAGYKTAVATSEAIEVGRGYLTTKPVLVTGKPVIGRLLTGKTSKWGPGGQIVYSYQWYREWEPITKATKKTYRLKPKDRGHNISVRVTARKKAYYKDTQSSRAVLIK